MKILVPWLWLLTGCWFIRDFCCRKVQDTCFDFTVMHWPNKLQWSLLLLFDNFIKSIAVSWAAYFPLSSVPYNCMKSLPLCHSDYLVDFGQGAIVYMKVQLASMTKMILKKNNKMARTSYVFSFSILWSLLPIKM